MSVKPIIFSAPMVRALIENRKTQTRRVLKPQPEQVLQGEPYWHVGGYRLRTAASNPLRVPYAVGDLLWVREAWQVRGLMFGKKPSGTRGAAPSAFHYRATDDAWKAAWGPWRPSIHMPRWASRLTLRVTAVKVERLQEISEADAIAEGIRCDFGGIGLGMYVWCDDDDVLASTTARLAFASLWAHIHGAEAWDANPWVVAPTFEVIRANVDHVDALGRIIAKPDASCLASSVAPTA